MQALTIFAGPICFTFTQQVEIMAWMIAIFILWPIVVGTVYGIYRLVKHFSKSAKRIKTKSQLILKRLAWSAYGLTSLAALVGLLAASNEITDATYGCGTAVKNDLSSVSTLISLVFFMLQIAFIIMYFVEPFISRNKSKAP